MKLKDILLWGGIAGATWYLIKKRATAKQIVEEAVGPIPESKREEQLAQYQQKAAKNWENALRTAYPDLEIVSTHKNGELICTRYKRHGVLLPQPACALILVEAAVLSLSELIDVAREQVEQRPVPSVEDIMGYW